MNKKLRFKVTYNTGKKRIVYAWRESYIRFDHENNEADQLRYGSSITAIELIGMP